MRFSESELTRSVPSASGPCPALAFVLGALQNALYFVLTVNLLTIASPNVDSLIPESI